jgi:hypothetical protein
MPKSIKLLLYSIMNLNTINKYPLPWVVGKANNKAWMSLSSFCPFFCFFASAYFWCWAHVTTLICVFFFCDVNFLSCVLENCLEQICCNRFASPWDTMISWYVLDVMSSSFLHEQGHSTKLWFSRSKTKHRKCFWLK